MEDFSATAALRLHTASPCRGASGTAVLTALLPLHVSRNPNSTAPDSYNPVITSYLSQNTTELFLCVPDISEDPMYEPSNNPFLPHNAPAHQRFPDISSSSSPEPVNQQYASWQQPGTQQQPQQQGYPAQFGQQPQQYTQQPQPQWNQQVAPPYSPQTLGQPSYQQQQQGFQPGSQFTGYQSPSGQSSYAAPQQPQYTGFSGPSSSSSYSYLYQQQQPQRSQQSGPDLSQFDPLSQQRHDPTPQLNFLNGGSTRAQSSAPPQGSQHPRDVLRAYKLELEGWDQHAWAQLLGSCEVLQSTWEGRKAEVERAQAQAGGYGYGYNPEMERLKSVRLVFNHFVQRILIDNPMLFALQFHQEATTNADTVAAAGFQLKEVRETWRQSSDPSSKRRVREACNAALSSLPNWPS